MIMVFFLIYYLINKICLKERIIFMSPEYRSILEINEYFNYELSDLFSLGIFIITIE